MSLRPWLIGLLLLLPAATGCLRAAEEDEPDRFAVVTVEGEIVERGEERAYHPCGRPVWSAGLSTDDRRLTVLERHVPEDAPQLAVWDDVVEMQAGNFSACEWPVLSISTAGLATWALAYNDLERSFEVQRTGEALALDGTNLSAGDSRTVPIDAHPEGSNYTYRGNLTFTFHGLWPAQSFETVTDEEAIRGSQGVVRTW